MPNVVVEVFGDCVVLVQGERDLTVLEWAAFMERARHPTVTKIIVITFGGTIDGSQRKDAQAILREGKEVFVVSDSSTARVVSSALRWLGLKLTNYKSTELDQALAAAGLLSPKHPGVRERVHQMVASLGQ
jgi:L-asparaginase/Glu-tRNA(Gln) amidotransferase subunit D